jgi:hypothetical protein
MARFFKSVENSKIFRNYQKLRSLKDPEGSATREVKYDYLLVPSGIEFTGRRFFGFFTHCTGIGGRSSSSLLSAQVLLAL